MSRFSQLGNDLYSGKKSYDIVGRRNRFYLISLVLTVVSLVGLLGLGLNFGIEFSGGSEFRVQGVTNSQDYEQKAQDAIGSAGSCGSSKPQPPAAAAAAMQPRPWQHSKPPPWPSTARGPHPPLLHPAPLPSCRHTCGHNGPLAMSAATVASLLLLTVAPAALGCYKGTA